MSQDPIMKEIHEVREAFAKKFNYDLKALSEELNRQMKEDRRETVSLAPKRIAEKPLTAAKK
jgi:hypothetical protein